MIVLDTAVLLYATGAEHEFRDPCRALIAQMRSGRIRAGTTVEVVQEFAHVRARRRGRTDAVGLAQSWIELMSPLLPVSESTLLTGLRLFADTEQLGSFDAVLAAAALASGADALVSADSAFSEVPGLTHVVPTAAAVDALLSR